MIKKIGYMMCLLFAIEIAGCSWFWNQEPACPQGYDQTVQGCKGMPPFPVGATGSDASVDSNSGTDSDAD